MAVSMEIGLIVLLHGIGCSASFHVNGIQACQSTSGLASYMRSQGIEITSQHAMENSLLFTLNKTQLQHYCSLVDQCNDCIDENVFGYCDINLRLVLQGFRDGTTYICSDTLAEYLNIHIECMQYTTLRDQLKQCVKRSLAEMKADTRISQICSDGQDGERCQVKAVQKQCGLRTSAWYRGLVHRYDRPMFDHVGCALYDEKDDQVYSGTNDKVHDDKDSQDHTQELHKTKKHLPIWALGPIIIVAIFCAWYYAHVYHSVNPQKPPLLYGLPICFQK